MMGQQGRVRRGFRDAAPRHQAGPPHSLRRTLEPSQLWPGLEGRRQPVAVWMSRSPCGSGAGTQPATHGHEGRCSGHFHRQAPKATEVFTAIPLGPPRVHPY